MLGSHHVNRGKVHKNIRGLCQSNKVIRQQKQLCLRYHCSTSLVLSKRNVMYSIRINVKFRQRVWQDTDQIHLTLSISTVSSILKYKNIYDSPSQCYLALLLQDSLERAKQDSHPNLNLTGYLSGYKVSQLGQSGDNDVVCMNMPKSWTMHPIHHHP